MLNLNKQLLIRQNDKIIYTHKTIDQILSEYRPLILKISHYIFKNTHGLELEDIIQNTNIATINLFNSYNVSCNVDFGFYAKKYLFYNASRICFSESRFYNTNVISIEDHAIENFYGSNYNEFNNILDSIQFKNMLSELNILEKKIVLLKLKGYSQNSISEKLNISQSTISRTLKTIRKKYKN